MTAFWFAFQFNSSILRTSCGNSRIAAEFPLTVTAMKIIWIANWKKKTGISQGARQNWKRKQANGARENAGAMPRLVLGLYLIGCISGWHESDLDQSQSQSNFYRFRYWMKMILTNFKLEQNTLKFPILVLKVKEGYSLIGYKSDRICLPKEISPNKSTDISFRLSQGRLKPVKSLCFL